ncbi:FmtA-like protein [Luteitalea pratensis]|uniref:FmtA-like protein n=1 Tax=Luteitalea pratensis TaxID=1855912 RepID=A0A143PJB5_LUTPR|nr:serine hydrolase domain-containing protein [Luteitalea pratensis]AMY08657.1 FmtA-like protein [Luteitalea pratensis]
MRTLLLLPTAFVMSACMASTGGQQAGQVERRERVERGLRGAVTVKGRAVVRHALTDRMSEWHVRGVSIAVIDEGRVAWAQGYGQTGDGGPVTVETRFQAASISKPVAAMTALRLVELGTLTLDADVNTQLKRWKVPASAAAVGEPVTLRRLLSHTAGLTVHGFPGYAVGAQVPSLVQLLDGVTPANTAAVRIDLKPGTQWRYSGGGYEVMQLLIEDVTGEPFERVAQRLVLGPLGMTHSTYEQPLPAAALALAAAGHDDHGVVIPGKRHTYPEQTAAGLWTTPSDLALVILEIQKPGRVLRRETVETMLTPVLQDYGLGFGVNTESGKRSFGHGGSNEGFRCQIHGHRDRPSGAVVMTNAEQGGRLTADVLRAVASEYGWPDMREREVTIATVPLETLRSYEGRYHLGGRDGVVAATDGHLTLQVPDGSTIALQPIGNGVFVDLDSRIPDITFSLSTQGKMQLAIDNQVAVRK